MIDDELRALMAAEPSPGWRARLHAQVAAERDRARIFVLPRAVLAVAALVVALAVAAGWPHDPVDRNARPIQTIEARALPITPLSPVVVPTAIAAHSPTPGVLLHRPARVQVDPAEARALRSLFATAASLPPVDIPAPATAPIVVPQISIEPLTHAMSEGDRQ
jgi:hypothetical protein